MKYNHIVKSDVKLSIRKVFRAVMKELLGDEFEFDRVGPYKFANDDEEIFILNVNDDDDSIIFSLEEEISEDVVITVEQQYDKKNNKIILVVNGAKTKYESFKALDEDVDSIKDDIYELLEDYLDNTRA